MTRAMAFGAMTTVGGSLVYANERGWDQDRTLKYVADNLNPVVVRDGKPHINANFMSFQNPENGQWMSMLTWEKDGWRLLFGAAALAGGDTEAANLTLGNYFSARLGVLPRSMKEVLTNRDFRGLPIRKEKGWAGLLQLLQYEATQSVMPSAFREIGAATIPNFPGGQQSGTGAALNVSGFGRARPISPFDTIDRAVQDAQIGKRGGGFHERYRDLPPDLRGEFDKAHPAEVKAVQEYRTTRGRDAFDRIRAQTSEGLAALAPVAEQDKALYREQAGDFVRDQAMATQRELQRLKDEGVNLGDREGDLGLLDRYFAATEPATDKTTHVTDFDKRDLLEDEFRDGLKPDEVARLDAMLVYSTDPVYQQLKLAKRELDQGGYFDRRDRLFKEWKADLIGDPSVDQAEKAAAREWGNPDDLRQWIQERLKQEGVAPQLYSVEPIWSKDWMRYYTQENGIWLEDNPRMDARAVEWGYQDRTHSEEADRLYEQRTGLEPPIPK